MRRLTDGERDIIREQNAGACEDAPEAEPVERFSEEVLAVARSTWAAVVRKPSILDQITGASAMPPAIAVDRVQDVTDDRNQAIDALFWAAAEVIEQALPARSAHPRWASAHAVAGYLRVGATSLAEANAHIEETGREIAQFPSREDNLFHLNAYSIWAREARRQIAICHELAALWVS